MPGGRGGHRASRALPALSGCRRPGLRVANGHARLTHRACLFLVGRRSNVQLVRQFTGLPPCLFNLTIHSCPAQAQLALKDSTLRGDHVEEGETDALAHRGHNCWCGRGVSLFLIPNPCPAFTERASPLTIYMHGVTGSSPTPRSS